MNLGVLAVVKWEETTMHSPAGTTWEELDILRRGTVVVVLGHHTDTQGTSWSGNYVLPNGTLAASARVRALGPNGVGLVWIYALDFPPCEEEP